MSHPSDRMHDGQSSPWTAQDTRATRPCGSRPTPRHPVLRPPVGDAEVSTSQRPRQWPRVRVVVVPVRSASATAPAGSGIRGAAPSAKPRHSPSNSVWSSTSTEVASRRRTARRPCRRGRARRRAGARIGDVDQVGPDRRVGQELAADQVASPSMARGRREHPRTTGAGGSIGGARRVQREPATTGAEPLGERASLHRLGSYVAGVGHQHVGGHASRPCRSTRRATVVRRVVPVQLPSSRRRAKSMSCQRPPATSRLDLAPVSTRHPRGVRTGRGQSCHRRTRRWCRRRTRSADWQEDDRRGDLVEHRRAGRAGSWPAPGRRSRGG